MQNPSMSKPSKQIHDIAESAKENIDQAVPELRNKVKGIASEASEQLSHAKQQAKGWVQNNYGKTLTLVGAVAVIGTLGYLLGRTNSHSELWSSWKQST
jgi:ElaB/YqjD/DUF883 family membrane-anchored ribosome-binding protein